MASLPLLRRKLGLIILGNSGVGKSFLANVLLGQEAFVHLATPRAVTTQTEFKEINLGNGTYAIFNIPGLVEADQKRIEMNKVEIGKAFSKRPMSIILYVFGSQGGRIRDEDVVAFNALNKAYPFELKSLVIIVNGLPKDRPKNYEGEVIVLLEELIKLPCRNLCVLDTIDKNNQDEKQKLKNKLFQVIVERTPLDHRKKQDIELQSDDVRNAKEQIKALQAAFQQNKKMYEEKIQEQQTVYDQMFAKIRNENENMRRLVERQTEETRKFKSRMREQEATYKKNQEQQNAQHREAMHQMQEAHKTVIEEAKRANQLKQFPNENSQNINLTSLNQQHPVASVSINAPQNNSIPYFQPYPMVYVNGTSPGPTIESINKYGRRTNIGLTGKCYCGGFLDVMRCWCCDGRCGPDSGCNCSACMQLDVEKRRLPKGTLINRDGALSRSGIDGRTFYCGRPMMPPTTFSDGYCGPDNGLQCQACEILNQQTQRYAALLF